MTEYDLFQTVALYENKDMCAVLINLQSLGRVAQVHCRLHYKRTAHALHAHYTRAAHALHTRALHTRALHTRALHMHALHVRCRPTDSKVRLSAQSLRPSIAATLLRSSWQQASTRRPSWVRDRPRVPASAEAPESPTPTFLKERADYSRQHARV